MGDIDSITSLLEANLSSINNILLTHQKMIFELQQENHTLKKMLELSQKQSSDPLKTEVINKFKRNRKRMIKNKLLETIKFGHNLSIPEIKEILVDQLKYCSKATFYRYIEELKSHDFILINESNIARIKPLVEVV